MQMGKATAAPFTPTSFFFVFLTKSNFHFSVEFHLALVSVFDGDQGE
jgi:hypothetical protein